MEENYSVQNKLHDANSSSWSNNVVTQKNNRTQAETVFHSEIARLNEAAGYDFVAVIMLDTQGHSTSWFRDSRVAPEPPEPVE